MSIDEFAEWAGVDRRKLAENLIDIPAGPVPPLPPGKVPARRISKTRRIFPKDFRGEPHEIGVVNGDICQKTFTNSTRSNIVEPLRDGPYVELLDRGLVRPG